MASRSTARPLSGPRLTRGRIGVAALTSVAALALAMTACDGADDDPHGHHDVAEDLDCSEEPRAEPYVVGWSKSGALVDVAFVNSTPAPPAKTENTWRLSITDQMTSSPVEGATLELIPTMPDHGHGTTKDAVITPVADMPGHYDASPVFLHMAGYWEVDMNITLSDGQSDSVMFNICVAN